MLALALAVASLASGWSTSLTCLDPASAATEALAGPDGVVAGLRVSTADDHRKPTHLCNAEYELSYAHAGGETPSAVNLISTDAAWGRSIFMQLDGFSEDGKSIFGLIREGGPDRFIALIEFDTADGKVHLLLLPRVFRRRCAGNVSVVATLGKGVVLASGCGTATRWLVEPRRLPNRSRGLPDAIWNGDFSIGRVERLPVGSPVMPLRDRKTPVETIDSAPLRE